MKRILVTGASGFIGYHLSLALKSRKDFVIGLDNFNSYYPVSLKRAREKMLKERGISVIEGDITDTSLLDDLLEKHEITHVVHLAAQAGVRFSLQNPEAYIKSNIEGFLSVLEALRKRPSIPLTFASSSSVYGENSKTPFSPDDITDSPVSLYGATKKSNELMAKSYHHLFGIKACGLRFFTVYGPWGRPDMAYFSFCQSILENRPIQLFNHGNLKRDFTYIDDIIQGTLSAIDLESPWEIFNLGNHQPVELHHFVKIIEDAVGKKAQIELLPMQPGDVHSTFADIETAKKRLGFFPKTSLEKGIPLFVQWFKDHFQKLKN